MNRDMLLVSKEKLLNRKQYGLCDRETNNKSINGEIYDSDGYVVHFTFF